MKVFLLDIAKCSGCYNCQIACKDEHCENEWMPYAKPQSHGGQFWMHVREREHGQLPKVRVEYMPVPCQHCDSPACLAAYPEAGYKRKDGLVILDPEKAVNAGIVDACPYHTIFWNDNLGIAQKCTGCAHLVDVGKLPHCVDLCANGALRFGEEEDFAEEIAAAELLEPLENATFDTTAGIDAANTLAAGATLAADLKPRVYYLNRPHLFIAGDVWDPEADEIIEQATVTLTMPDGSTQKTETDDFGDFWFRHVDAGFYNLRIEVDGFIPAERNAIKVDRSLNLGDFPLQCRQDAPDDLSPLTVAIDNDQQKVTQNELRNTSGETLEEL